MLVEDASGVHRSPTWLKEAIAVNLRSYQAEWLMDAQGRDIAHRGARQVGKDRTWSFETALDMGYRPRRQWSILSASMSHSRDFLADVSQHLTYLEGLNRLNGYSFPRRIKDSADQIVLDNGSIFRAYAATAKNAQGRRGNIILNEIGIMPRADMIYETAEAVVRGQRTQGLDACFRIIGNAAAQGSFFHEFWTGAMSRSFLKITSTWEDCIGRWLRDDLGHPAAKVAAWVKLQVDDIIERLGMAGFAQWYRCAWRAPSAGFFDPKLLTARQYDPDNPPDDFPDLSDPDVRQTVGWDPSRRRHPSGFAQVLEGRERARQKIRRAFIHNPGRMVGATWPAQEAELDRRIRERRTVKVVIDRQGIGDKPAEDAARRYGESMVEGYAFSAPSRMVLFNNMLMALQRDIAQIPTHTDFRMEMESIQQTYSRDGKEGIVIPEVGGKHGDCAVAGCLGLWGLTRPRAVDRVADAREPEVMRKMLSGVATEVRAVGPSSPSLFQMLYRG